MGMAESKEDLLRKARDGGLDVSDSDTKADIESKLATALGDDALGPHEGEDGVPDLEPDAHPVKAVRPKTWDEIPEGLR